MSIPNTIKGKDVVFSIKSGDVYLPFVCAKEITISVDAEEVSVKTVGDGYAKKFAYQNYGYSIDLTSVLRFDDTMRTGWDFLENMVQFITVRWQALYTDSTNGQVQRLRGVVLIKRTNLAASATDLVMSDISLLGSGPLDMSN